MAGYALIRPFKLIKPYMPKSLYARVLMILVVPLLLVTGVTIYLFLDHHLDSMTKNLAANISNDVAGLVELYEKAALSHDELQVFAEKNYQIALEYIPLTKKTGPRIPKTPIRMIGSWFLDETLSTRLTREFNSHIDSDYIMIEVELPREILQFKLNRKRLLSKTTPVYLMWVLGLPIILFIIAAIFMRNQVRPIRTLVTSVDRFGKGLNSPEIKPAGATEVRQATIAFNRMRERIKRQIAQRTEMLAGVSHDLRTPLTRMELELAMLKDTPEVLALRQDVKDMRHMIDSYLSFAKGEAKEEPVMTNLYDLLEAVAEPYSNKISMPKRKSIRRQVKVLSLKRCFQNLIQNADKYADKIQIDVIKEKDYYQIYIDDNGPGIPQDKREEVFQPFYRLDSARNLDVAGTGLGLSIAQDVISQHGGTIQLDDAPIGGVRVSIRLPA